VNSRSAFQHLSISAKAKDKSLTQRIRGTEEQRSKRLKRFVFLCAWLEAGMDSNVAILTFESNSL
jgi:hypothetical protein